jgi:hypothetical protein
MIQNKIIGSQIKQDIIALELLNYKKHGIYVDIGCAGAIRFSNTYLMEKEYQWSGIAIDIIDENGDGEWSEIRPNTTHIIEDALKINYLKTFEENKLPKSIDFLSIDLEPPELTLQCLYKIPFDQYSFNIIAFETDEYRDGGDKRRDKSRNFLTSLGYKLMYNLNRQDDIYIKE